MQYPHGKAVHQQQQQMISAPGHKQHKSIELEVDNGGATSKKSSGYKYGSMIGKGIGNVPGHQFQSAARAADAQHSYKMSREMNKKESRLAKYFMNKLAKSKSIADISQKGLNLSKITPMEDAHQSQYASTARNDAKTKQSPDQKPLDMNSGADDANMANEKDNDQKQGSQMAKNEPSGQASQQERLLNKSQSLTKNTIWGANRFNATTSYMKAKQRAQNLSLGFDQVKGLRNRSFLGKQRGLGDDPNSSVKRRPLYLQAQQLKRNDPRYLRDTSNPKNLSINSRLLNPRPLNNLSKNMSLKEDQESFPVDVAQMHTDVIKERGFDGSQYENVSMGSIGSFEAEKQQKELINPGEEGEKKSLIPIFNNSSPGKAARQPIGSFKHPNKGNWESNFYTQGTDANNRSTKKLEVNTSKMMYKGGISGMKRTPLTSKYSQAPKISKHKKQSTSEFEFIRKYPKDQQDTLAKMSAISPLKFERASYLVKNRLISSGKFASTQSDQNKMWKTHRASQQVASIGMSMHQKNPSLQLQGALNPYKDRDYDSKVQGEQPGQVSSSSQLQKSSQKNYEDLAAAKQEAQNEPQQPRTFSNLPYSKRNASNNLMDLIQVQRPKQAQPRSKNVDQQSVPQLQSPHLQYDDGGRGQRNQNKGKMCSPAYTGKTPLTPVSLSKRGPGEASFAATQVISQNKIKPYSGQNQKKTLKENKSVKNVPGVGGPKEHKRSMTLATRDALKDQAGDAFQSIIEEPAEDQPKSNDNKSKEGNKLRDNNNSSIRVAKNASRGQSHFQLQSSKLGNRGISQAKEKEYLGARSNIRDHKQSMKIPRGSVNFKTDYLQNGGKSNYQVQQQYGLLNSQPHLTAFGTKVKSGQVPSIMIEQSAQMNSQSQTKMDKIDNGSRNNSQVPQNTRQRSFLRTTRNTIANHAPKSGISIPEQLSMSQRYAQYQNNNSRKAADRNLTFLQEFKKSNQTANKYLEQSKTSQSRPISTSKPQSTQVTARGVPYLPLGQKFNNKISTQDSEADPNTHSARRNQKNASSKERQQSINEVGKKQSSYKKSLTSKKSINNASKIDLLDEKVKGHKPQMNNLVIEQPVTTRNNFSKQAKTLVDAKALEKQYPSASQSTEEPVKKMIAAPTAQSTKNMHQSNTNPQQPSSSLSGMLVSKSQLTTSRSPRKEELSAEPKMPEFPLTSEEALTHYSSVLNDYEKQEIMDYNKKIYYLGQNCKSKVKGHVIKMVPNTNPPKQRNMKDRRSSQASATGNNNWQPMIPSVRQVERLQQMDIYNYGYDDDNGDYQTVLKDHIGYRFEVLQALGSGSFGQALRCLDHSNGQEVAVKIIRNKKKFQYQAGMELKILLYLNKHDKQDQNNVIRVKDFLLFREHLIIAFELLSINLYEFIKNNNFQGVSQNLIRRFAIQILQALKYHHDHSLVHCDMKPENILLKQENKSGIKVIDYGSSCFMGQRIYTYIQSRFYRAPEIILGIPYTTAIDMWSFGAIVAELYTGFPLFPGESEMEQLAYIMELYGVPPDNVLRLSSRFDIFFTHDYVPKLQPNSRGKIRYPNQKKLEDVLRCTDENFLDFLNKCFVWDPVRRMTALEALQHPWILEGLPEKVLKHHKKMFGYKDDKVKMKQLTLTDIQGFPKDKKDQSIHDILNEIREDQEKERQILLAKSRLESSRNNLTRQTFKTSEREKTSRAEDCSENVRSQKSLRSQLHNSGHPPTLEVAEMHLQTNKMAQTQLVKLPSDMKSSSGQQSPYKERKSRKQRMENSELKLVNKLSQYQNYDNEFADDQTSQEHMLQKSTSIKSGKRKSTSIKVYQPELDEGSYSEMDHHYMTKLAALKAQFEQESKKLDEIEEKMINLEHDNSLSQVRDEELMNRHINTIQTNILNNKSQVTQQIVEPDVQEYQQLSDAVGKMAAGSGQQYPKTAGNKVHQSQPTLYKQTTSQHYKPKRRSQQKLSNAGLNAGSSNDNLSKQQYGAGSDVNAMSLHYSDAEQVAGHNSGLNRQALSKNALKVQSVGLEEQQDVESGHDLTPLQYKYKQ